MFQRIKFISFLVILPMACSQPVTKVSSGKLVNDQELKPITWSQGQALFLQGRVTHVTYNNLNPSLLITLVDGRNFAIETPPSNFAVFFETQVPNRKSISIAYADFHPGVSIPPQ